jgi:hypothetical protein
MGGHTNLQSTNTCNTPFLTPICTSDVHIHTPFNPHRTAGQQTHTSNRNLLECAQLLQLHMRPVTGPLYYLRAAVPLQSLFVECNSDWHVLESLVCAYLYQRLVIITHLTEHWQPCANNGKVSEPMVLTFNTQTDHQAPPLRSLSQLLS